MSRSKIKLQHTPPSPKKKNCGFWWARYGLLSASIIVVVACGCALVGVVAISCVVVVVAIVVYCVSSVVRCVSSCGGDTACVVAESSYVCVATTSRLLSLLLAGD